MPRELVFMIGGEGWGFGVYRVKADDGDWRFYSDGGSIGMDDNDDECWRYYTSKTYSSIAEVMDSSAITKWFLIGNVRDVHPDHRGELIAWAKKARKKLAKDFFQRFPAFEMVTAEIWIDGYSNNAEFRRRDQIESAKMFDQLRRKR